jgi:dynactin complex subunit
MTCVSFLKKNNEVLKIMKIFKNLVETKIDHKLKVLRTDCGREFLSQAFSDFCNGFNIGRQLIQPITPQQNGITKRKNKTFIMKKMCPLQLVRCY